MSHFAFRCIDFVTTETRVIPRESLAFVIDVERKVVCCTWMPAGFRRAQRSLDIRTRGGCLKGIDQPRFLSCFGSG